jgi:hypothetical protein
VKLEPKAMMVVAALPAWTVEGVIAVSEGTSEGVPLPPPPVMPEPPPPQPAVRSDKTPRTAKRIRERRNNNELLFDMQGCLGCECVCNCIAVDHRCQPIYLICIIEKLITSERKCRSFDSRLN